MYRFSTFYRALPIAALFGAAALTACAPIGRGVQRVGTAVHEQTVDYDRRLSNLLESEGAQMERERRHVHPPSYCYRTLGDITCYPRAMLGQETRLVGKQIPDPMFDPLRYPLPQERPEAVYIDLAVNTAPVTPALQGYEIPGEVSVDSLPSLTPQAAIPAQGADSAPRQLMPAFEEAAPVMAQ